MSLIFYSACSPALVDDFTYPYHGAMTFKKFLKHCEVQKVLKKQLFSLHVVKLPLEFKWEVDYLLEKITVFSILF